MRSGFYLWIVTTGLFLGVGFSAPPVPTPIESEYEILGSINTTDELSSKELVQTWCEKLHPLVKSVVLNMVTRQVGGRPAPETVLYVQAEEQSGFFGGTTYTGKCSFYIKRLQNN